MDSPSSSIDGVTPSTLSEKKPIDPAVRSWKKIFLLIGIVYLLYFMWGAGLMTILPTATGELQWLASMGALRL